MCTPHLLNWHLAASFKSASLSGEPVALAKLLAEALNSPAIRDALAWFVREKQWINEQHLQLCRVAAPTFFEQKRAEWMLEQFRAHGLRGAHRPRRQRDRASGGESRRPLHRADGAPGHRACAAQRRRHLPSSRTGGCTVPGVSDNGAGLAALLAIARVISVSPDLQDIFHRLVFIANVGEEGEGNLSGMRYLCRQSSTGGRIQSFVVLDGPNNEHITSQALASRRFDISVTGPGGHSWSDYGIANPVHALSRAIAFFTEHRLPGNGSPRSSYNFGIIEGGSSINSIPTQARTKVDVRSESATKLDEIANLLTSSVERALESENDRASGGKSGREDQRDRLAAGRTTGRRRLHPAVRPRGGRAPGHPLAPGLRLHRRQRSALDGPGGDFDRRRRTRRRSAHAARVVPSRRP